LILVKTNARDMLTIKSSKLQRDRQYTIFVLRVKMAPRYIRQRSAKLVIVFYKTYFFCSFCKLGLIRLNPVTKNFLSLKLQNFEWSTTLSQHYKQLPIDSDVDLANIAEFCRQQNIMILFKKKRKCESRLMLVQLIVAASGYNLTIKPYKRKYFDHSKIPQIFTYIRYFGFNVIHKYSSPILNLYEYPSIIYCFNLGRVTVAETDMWTKYVPTDVWGLVGLCLVLSSILYTITGTGWSKQSVELVLQNLVLFVNLFLKLTRILVRQSWDHKWKLMVGLELLFSGIIISVYENSITVSVVVPLVPKPFLGTKELYDNRV